ncbi:NADPH-dependent FMN reductase [Celeribacter indicus]|uniref:NADPH-dependent FMN reductase n=1 Tax=Celeribacter indicus TaxID=1208324 RepID=A0A0B5E1V9_9RHOB|nr:NADPH-dependent FMN reductase [Celeribacter indicus]AJE46457.1 NADPH-dependent FMN reductase [Celeribacter indicus]SDW57215.1 chromate reductase [Celeribacter indicus]
MAYKIAVLVGSLRRESHNRKLAHALTRLAPDSLDFTFVEIGDLPFYNEDLDTDTPPESWTRFRTEMKTVDGVLFVTPEYNRSVPATIKNALDVGSRPYGDSVWGGKPAAVVTGSPGGVGGFGANHHLRQSLVFLDMPPMQQPEAYIGGIYEMFDAEGEVKNADTRKFLGTVMAAFADWVGKHA